MRFAVRVGLGVALGGVALAVLAWLSMGTWLVALVAALLALVGFLGSFFVWTADRPEIGYEQVLFDMPNNLTSLALVGVFVGGAFAAGLLHAPEPAADPALIESAAQMTLWRDALAAVAEGAQNDALQARSLGEAPEGFVERQSAARESLARVQRELLTATLPEALTPMKEALLSGHVTLGSALEALDACAGGDAGACLTAIGDVGAWSRDVERFAEARAQLAF